MFVLTWVSYLYDKSDFLYACMFVCVFAFACLFSDFTFSDFKVFKYTLFKFMSL